MGNQISSCTSLRKDRKDFTLKQTLKICTGRSNQTPITRLTPLRCMRRDVDGQTYNVEPYEGGDYVAISYSWPDKKLWNRLHDSNESTMVKRSDAAVGEECFHFSDFARKAVEHAIQSMTCSVWLDFLCIDQQNVKEKVDQVALMDRFYNDARITVVLLEDVEISSEEFSFLQANLSRVREDPQEYLRIVRRILKARWFKRAWCSQEWVLSRSPKIYVHRSDDPYGEPIQFSWAALKNWMNRASIYDPTMKDVQLTDPRGMNTRTTANLFQTIAWAFGVVYDLGCYDQYDKVALVCNLIHADASDRISMPKTPGEGDDPQIVCANVIKVVNVLAILRGDFSLMLTSHVESNPLQGVKGFSWAGPSIRGDWVSQSWAPKAYQVEDDPGWKLNEKGLHLRGVAEQIVSQTEWRFVRNEHGLRVSVDDREEIHVSSDWLSENYPTSRPLPVNQAFFRDLCYVIEALNLTEVYRLLFDAVEWSYSEGNGDLKAQMQAYFTHYSLNLTFYTERISFLWAHGIGRLTLLTLSGGQRLVVRGNIPDLRQKTLFQPFVIRPRSLGFGLPTANFLVLIRHGGEAAIQYRCVGGVRGFGLLPSDVRIEAHIT